VAFQRITLRILPKCPNKKPPSSSWDGGNFKHQKFK
jgi:hypothetical protein